MSQMEDAETVIDLITEALWVCHDHGKSRTTAQ